MFFKEVKSIPAAVRVHIFLGQDVFPQLPWELEAESQASPPHKLLWLGVSYFGDTNQPGRLSHWWHWTICRFRQGWKFLISEVHRPLREQKCSEPEKLRHPGLQSRELPGGFGAQDLGKTKDRQARSLNWNHQFHTESSGWQIPVSQSGPSSGCSHLPAEGWSAQGCVNSCWDALNTDGTEHAGFILRGLSHGKCGAAPSTKKHAYLAVVPSWPGNDFHSLRSHRLKYSPWNGIFGPCKWRRTGLPVPCDFCIHAHQCQNLCGQGAFTRPLNESGEILHREKSKHAPTFPHGALKPHLISEKNQAFCAHTSCLHTALS